MTLQEGCQTITVAVNGETKNIPAGLDVLGLLRWLEIDPEKVAVELDREIVRQPLWDTTQVRPGAQIEIVQFVGGG
jgi:thiamine biosynthesis protein ThiS